MSIFTPFGLVVRWFNTAATAYVVGRVGWSLFLSVRQMQREKLHATEMRKRFVEEFEKEFGMLPEEELITLTLSTYNAVEHPLRKRINDKCSDAKKALDECLEGKWIDDFVRSANSNGKA